MTAAVSAYGRLGRAPRQHETGSGKPMTTASMAVTVEARERGADTSESTLWLSLVAFGRQADDLARHDAGDPVSASGRLQLSRYTTGEGEARESWQLVLDSLVSARTVRPKGGRRSGSGDAPASGGARPGGAGGAVGGGRGAGTRDRTEGRQRSVWPASGPEGPRDPDPPRRTDADRPFDDPLPF